MSDRRHEQFLLEIALQYRTQRRYLLPEDTAVYLWGFYANVRLAVLATQEEQVFVRPEMEDFTFPIDREDAYHYEEFLEARRVVEWRRELIERILTPAK